MKQSAFWIFWICFANSLFVSLIGFHGMSAK